MVSFDSVTLLPWLITIWFKHSLMIVIHCLRGWLLSHPTTNIILSLLYVAWRDPHVPLQSLFYGTMVSELDSSLHLTSSMSAKDFAWMGQFFHFPEPIFFLLFQTYWFWHCLTYYSRSNKQRSKSDKQDSYSLLCTLLYWKFIIFSLADVLYLLLQCGHKWGEIFGLFLVVL